MPYSTIEHINILKSCQINIFGTIVVINFYETGLFFQIVFNVRRVEILQYVWQGNRFMSTDTTSCTYAFVKYGYWTVKEFLYPKTSWQHLY